MSSKKQWEKYKTLMRIRNKTIRIAARTILVFSVIGIIVTVFNCL